MRTITATTASRTFSKLLNEVTSKGETFTILRLGKPIATISPTKKEAETQKAWHNLLNRLQNQKPLGQNTYIRDEIYEETLC